MNNYSSNRRIPLIMWMIPLCMGIGLIFFITSSPASASIVDLLGAQTPTQENLWGFANVPKPTYTPTPVMIPTDTPLPVETQVPVDTQVPVTETPASFAMEIVEDESVLAAPDSSSAPVISYGGPKYILVDISEQHMYVYDGGALLYSFVASTGIENSTRVGSFQVQSKIPNAYASTWDLWMPNWLGIYWSHGLENGIHALPILSNGATLWAGFLGRPVSFGCVVLATYDAQVLYDWVELGTPVDIQW